MKLQRTLSMLFAATAATAIVSVASGQAALPTPLPRPALTSDARLRDHEGPLFRFLANQQHAGTGLVESFVANAELPAPFLQFLTASRPAFVYDVSLSVHAWLARGHPKDLVRADAALQALLAAQAPDGRVPNSLVADTAAVLDGNSSTGNVMWVGLSFLRGFEVLGDAAYLDAALLAADYALRNLENTVGHGGFVLSLGSTIVSTEHNVDAWALFERLARRAPGAGQVPSQSELQQGALHARIFVESRFDPVLGLTYTGTDASGVATATAPVPEDTQTWTLLALGREKWARGYRWLLKPAPTGLFTTSTSCPRLGTRSVQGPSFSDADSGEVWFEGLAHTRLAAQWVGDLGRDAALRRTLFYAQQAAPNADELGLVATCDTLATGFGFEYFNALAVAPAAFAILAERRHDPFWNVSTDGGLQGHPAASLPTVSLDAPPDLVFGCQAGGPCFFTVSGTSTSVFGAPALAIHVLVEPTNPSAGFIFTQFPAAAVQNDGKWTTTAQLGSAQFPACSGHELRISAIVVDTGVALPGFYPAVTPANVPGIVTTSGVLSATVAVGDCPP